MDYYIIKTLQGLKDFCEKYKALNLEVLGEDTETTELEPRNGNLRLIQLSDGKDLTVLIDRKEILESEGFGHFWGIPDARNPEIEKSYYIWESLKEILESPKIIKVAHNVKFENKWLKYGCNIDMAPVFDTFTAEQLLNYPGPHGLGFVLEKYLPGVEIDKSEQKSDWSGVLTQSQCDYAAKDAYYMPALREKQRPLILSTGQQLAAKIEFEFTPVLAKVELDGIKFNRQKHLGFIKQMHENRDRTEIVAQEKLGEALSNDLANPNEQLSLFAGSRMVKLTSIKQVTQALIKLGVPIFDEKTEEGKRMIAKYKREKRPYATGTNWKKQLEPLVPYHPEALNPLKEFRDWEKLLTSYGPGLIEKLVEWRGHDRLFPEFKQIGAPTGRMACKEPNVQQVTDKLLRLRENFDAPEGYVLIDCDYSQIELRILAHLCQDEAFMEAFILNRDLHSDTASKVFGIEYDIFEDETHPLNKEYKKKFRSPAKNMNFGIVYGISAIGLAVMIKQSEKVAQEMIDKYYATYPKMRMWLENAANHAKTNLFARTMSGRIQLFDKPQRDPETGRPLGMGLIGRNGRNMPVQGTGADILKRAARLVHDEISKYDARIVNLVHDEILVECKREQAEEVKIIVEREMKRAAEEFITRVPILADAKICETWSEKDN